MNFIFFDVANTLLHKPLLWEKIMNALNEFGYQVSNDNLKRNHKLLSEVIKFPDKTSEEFYHRFNSELLYSLGIIPKQEVLDTIFNSCSYLDWEPFEDVIHLKGIDTPCGIISNWDKSLPEKLNHHIDKKFELILGSEEIGFSKPDLRVFDRALDLVKQFNPEKIFFIGDSIKLDIEPASHIGINSILIDRENVYPDFSGTRISSFKELKQIIK